MHVGQAEISHNVLLPGEESKIALDISTLNDSDFRVVSQLLYRLDGDQTLYHATLEVVGAQVVLLVASACGC